MLSCLSCSWSRRRASRCSERLLHFLINSSRSRVVWCFNSSNLAWLTRRSLRFLCRESFSLISSFRSRLRSSASLWAVSSCWLRSRSFLMASWSSWRWCSLASSSCRYFRWESSSSLVSFSRVDLSSSIVWLRAFESASVLDLSKLRLCSLSARDWL